MRYRFPRFNRLQTRKTHLRLFAQSSPPTASIFFSYSKVLYFTAMCNRSLSVIFNNFHICSKRFCTLIFLTLFKIVVNKRLLEIAFSLAIGSNKSIRCDFGLRFSISCSNWIMGSSSGFNVGSRPRPPRKTVSAFQTPCSNFCLRSFNCAIRISRSFNARLRSSSNAWSSSLRRLSSGNLSCKWNIWWR